MTSVSVVVAVHNGSRTLQRCLDSIIEQDYAVELIVVDGASTDGTVGIIEQNAAHVAWWVSEPDGGVYDAWNKALDHVTGDWVIFLGADDTFATPTVLSEVAPSLAAAEGHARVAYAAVEVVDADGDVVHKAGEPWATARAALPERMAIPHQGVFHHRSLFETHGRFDPSFHISGDYELLLRELLDHDAVFIPDIVVVKMGAGGLSDDPRMMARHVRETHRARYMHGLVSTPDWRSFEVFRATTHARLTLLFGRRTADRVGDLYRAITRQGRGQGNA